MHDIIITNNKFALDAFEGEFSVKYFDVSYNELMKIIRDYVHEGHRLLTHPLSGSVKPNENPFKSVMLSHKKGALDLDSVRIIENAVITAEKFPVKFKNLSKQMEADFSTIDLSLIRSCR